MTNRKMDPACVFSIQNNAKLAVAVHMQVHMHAPMRAVGGKNLLLALKSLFLYLQICAVHLPLQWLNMMATVS